MSTEQLRRAYAAIHRDGNFVVVRLAGILVWYESCDAVCIDPQLSEAGAVLIVLCIDGHERIVDRRYLFVVKRTDDLQPLNLHHTA